jgi:hypothetical protein
MKTDGGPALSVLDRDRAIAKKETPKGNNGVHRCGAGVRKSIEPKVLPAQRLRGFPDPELKNSGN